ncbi:MAG: hypothetical protein JKX73_03800 [Flavobacteriales bacterium]|nr:hypothetical protein [Flavobacteriales bacterium]
MKHFSYILRLIVIVITIVVSTGNAMAQTKYFNGNKYQIIVEFDTTKFIISKGEVISKTLKIVNNGNEPLRFSLDLTFPKEWRTLNPRDRQYDLPAGDSIFVPIRIIPLGKTKGNTSYLIYAYIINGDQVPIASSYFLASRKKIVNWALNVTPGEKLYFKNGERELDFSLNVMNLGNEETDLILDVNNRRKDRLLVTDTNDRVIKEPAVFTLKELEDQTFYYKARSANSLRNYKRVDTEEFRPDKGAEYQKHSLFAKTHESALTGKGEIVRGKRIDFITLPNYTKANLYRKSSIPLILDANLSNFAGKNQPALSIGLRGNTLLKNNALLTYSSFNNFSSYIGSSRFLTNGSYYIGYFDKKFNFSSSSGPGSRHFNGYYRINSRHSVASSYFRAPIYFGKASRTRFSLNYQYRGDKFSHGARLSRLTSQAPGANTNTASYSVARSFMSGHNVALSVGVADNVFTDSTRTGYRVGVTYGGRYLKNTLTSSLNANLYSRNYSVYGNGNTLGLNHMSTYKVSQKWNVTLSNRYIDNRNLPQQFLFPTAKYILFTNQATFGRKIGEQSVGSEVFYNIANVDTILSHSRGLGVSVSKFALENSQLVALNIRGGYNRFIDESDPQDDVFFAQFFAFFKYLVWSGNVRYNYGSVAPSNRILDNGPFPQTMGASVSNQYHFANPHFLLESVFTYSYYNVFDRQSVGYTPDFYYFTDSGWRIRLTTGFYVTSAGGQNRFSASPNSGSEDGEPKRKVSTSVYLNLGVRKEFGVPIPWAKTVYPTVKFLAFIDHDGNGVQDQGEVSLENVVIRFGKWELLTDLYGTARVENVRADSMYQFSVFSLVDLKGYFPKTESEFMVLYESVVMVPFVKGIKVYGSVYVDRERMAPGALDKLDLSRIMIHATDHGLEPTNTLTNGDGSFQFYLPYGEYTISVDDRILGTNFRILQNDIEIELDQMSDGMFISFYIVERRRKVNIKKFNGNGDVIDGTERTIQPGDPGSGTTPGAGDGSGGTPGGSDGSTGPDGASNDGSDPSSSDSTGAPGDNTGVPTLGTDVSLRDPADQIPVRLPNKTISWEETEFYIVASAFSGEDAATSFIDGLDRQDNALIVRSKDNLQFLVVFAYRTEDEARGDLGDRQSVAPAAWITKKEK